MRPPAPWRIRPSSCACGTFDSSGSEMLSNKCRTTRRTLQGRPTVQDDSKAQATHCTIRVLAAVIRRDGRWLVCRRPAHKRHGGLWEFPGGKLEPGESLLEAATRELEEELAVRVTGVG